MNPVPIQVCHEWQQAGNGTELHDMWTRARRCADFAIDLSGVPAQTAMYTPVSTSKAVPCRLFVNCNELHAQVCLHPEQHLAVYSITMPHLPACLHRAYVPLPSTATRDPVRFTMLRVQHHRQHTCHTATWPLHEVRHRSSDAYLHKMPTTLVYTQLPHGVST